MASMDPELASAIIASAKRLGVNPVDIGTAISYETGGRFSPSLWGGKNNNYLGLIQFGPEERAKYGVSTTQSAPEQMKAVESYLRDRGVKPGMGLMDIYSTINAGSPGLYNRSDAGNGGAPGTVADKVNNQMADHKAAAARLLGVAGGEAAAPSGETTSPVDPTETAPAPGTAPLALTAPVGALAQDPTTATTLGNLGAALRQSTAQQAPQFGPLQHIEMPKPSGQAAALAAALAAHYAGGGNV